MPFVVCRTFSTCLLVSTFRSMDANAAKKCYGNEDRREDASNGNDRARHFLKSPDGGVARIHTSIDIELNRFHDDNCVIHNNADRKNQPEQTRRIDGKPESRKK